MSLPEQPPPPPGVHEETWCKNRLQQFAQRASMPLPVYRTVSEGSPHAPAFRGHVSVDGTCFTSPNTYSNRKMAEQEAARIALIGTREKVKSEGSSRVSEDTLFCKSIVYEYAVKTNLGTPTYITNQSASIFPTFVSSLILNGVTYVGDAGKTKKEAEQFVARSAVLSILGSESSTTMSEIVKTKFKMYDALRRDREPGTEANTLTDIGPSSEVGALETPVSVNKRKEVNVSGDTACIVTFCQPPTTKVEHTVGQASITQAIGGQPLHEFKKPRLTDECVPPPPLAGPIEFVPPASEQAMVCSTSGKKLNRKRRKAKKKMEQQSLSAMVPQSAC